MPVVCVCMQTGRTVRKMLPLRTCQPMTSNGIKQTGGLQPSGRFGVTNANPLRRSNGRKMRDGAGVGNLKFPGEGLAGVRAGGVAGP
jgi:hypothetical protein